MHKIRILNIRFTYKKLSDFEFLYIIHYYRVQNKAPTPLFTNITIKLL